MLRLLPALAVALGVVLSPMAARAACAVPETCEVTRAEIGANDPLEDLNRYLFAVNEVFDGVFFKPVAQLYNFAVPEFGRNRVRDFLDNLGTPVILANDVFQGEFGRAGTTISRFGINTTIGLGGLFDPAEGWGLPQHSEDFGQTLGVYGFGEGPYLYLPILGPNPPRDLFGRGVDLLLDPLTWIGGDTADIISISTMALNAVDIRARNIETLDELERTSIDYYAAVRSLYRQSRASAIRNGAFDYKNYELPETIDPGDLN